MGRISDLLQIFSTGAGLLSFGIVLVGAFFAMRSGVFKTTSAAQGSAISAMQSELETHRGKIEDLEKENTRLNQIIETMCAALKRKGFIITIQGEMINIEDRKGGTTTTRIRRVSGGQDDDL